jgi:hypothetical protein
MLRSASKRTVCVQANPLDITHAKEREPEVMD